MTYRLQIFLYQVSLLFGLSLFFGCTEKDVHFEVPYAIVLGIAQDAGYPQINCNKTCCASLWDKNALRQKVSCIGLVDPQKGKCWLIDATPDIKDQWSLLLSQERELQLDGILVTHAHIGHYSGLMHLGREAMGADKVKVYCMPRMKDFLETNGPWDQLVKLDNIELHPLKEDSIIQLSNNIEVKPFSVPHRDEYSETVGFEVRANGKSLVFIPDIDKWEKWERDIRLVVKSSDILFLDGTFYENGEIPGRDMSEIPHPFIQESMALFNTLDDDNRKKVHFIHLNHTNPALVPNSHSAKAINKAGYRLARESQRYYFTED